MITTDDVRIREIKELAPPSHLLREFPISAAAAGTTFESRRSIHRILNSEDDRLLVIIGPCSIHDPRAALEYARRLSEVRAHLQDDL
ncbi:MAG: 3-deoxy-7-phosphoheptulonate synthase, partial [Gammaproteobacteria bacterium]